MTDGPHKSLPLHRRYKVMMERATKRAYTVTEIQEAQRSALVWEFQRVPVAKIRSAIAAETENVVVFDSDGLVARLESIRDCHPGSSIVGDIVGELVADALSGCPTEEALVRAVESAIESHCERVGRQMEGHFLKKAGSRGVSEMRERLKLASDEHAVKAISAEILSSTKASHTAGELEKKSGIDDGISLLGAVA